MRLLSVLWVVSIATAKVVNDVVKFRMNFADLQKWSKGHAVVTDGLHYMTHFACDIGKCKYTLRIRSIGTDKFLTRAHKAPGDFVVDEAAFGADVTPYVVEERLAKAQGWASVNFRAILDKEWSDKKLNFSWFTPRRAGQECLGDIESRMNRRVEVPLNGQWSEAVDGFLSQVARPHYWFFVMEDCAGEFIRKFTDEFGVAPRVFLPNIQFEYELRVVNSDGGEMGSEHKYMTSVTATGAIASAAVLIFFVVKQFELKKKHVTRVHPVSQCLNISLLSMCVAFTFSFVNIQKLKWDGEGMPILEGFGNLIKAMSTLVLSVCVFAVALGYSLQVPSMTVPAEALVAGSICYSFIELILCFAQYKNFSFRYHFHMHQGAIPILIGAFKLFIALVFWCSCYATMSRDDILHEDVVKFLRKFRWRGILMLVGQPLVILLVNCTHMPYNQQRWIEIYSFLVEILSITYLGLAFLTTRTSYFKASELGSSVLPMDGLGNLSNRNKRHRLD